MVSRIGFLIDKIKYAAQKSNLPFKGHISRKISGTLGILGTLLTILCTLTSCQPAPSGPLEIHLVKQAAPASNSNTELDPNHCFYCIESIKEKVNVEPLLLESDIAGFDWVTQQIQLTEAGKDKVNKLRIPKKGLAVAFVLNGEPIYDFWFWTRKSRYGCDRVYAYPRGDFKLGFGLPKGLEYGDDPRFDKTLEAYVKSKSW